MARSSFGPRRATTWTASEHQKPMPRIVRLGRPANDNFRQPGWLTRAVVLGLAGLLLTFVLAEWRFF
ncbi:MAG: hypothetical protein LCH93_20330 [Proteobacteria bacterium]|uniref:hypothetical protein n=1 Tax=Reyranella massiliensis TaxID=445220 RepID=UPI0011D2984C|nr:hypothetical protein [Reyranella massiliensis]MCA0248965.1 hypothetical protein [Pseudomonadota bacterium]